MQNGGSSRVDTGAALREYVLRERGLNDPAILEIVHIVGFFNYINRLASALGVDPEPEWTR